MSKKDLPLILAGVGVFYLIITRSSTSPVFGRPVPSGGAGGGYPMPVVGSLATGISNFLSNLFKGPPIVSNPGTDVINTPGAYPSGGGTPGPYDSGDVCDLNSVQFNEQVCTEMGGTPYVT